MLLSKGLGNVNQIFFFFLPFFYFAPAKPFCGQSPKGRAITKRGDLSQWTEVFRIRSNIFSEPKAKPGTKF